MHWTDAEDMAAAILGLDEAADSEAIEMTLADRFDVSLEQFQKIAEALMPFTIPAPAALSGEVFNGFVANGAFIVKQPRGESDDARF